MTKTLTAILLSIAIPAVAHAQAAPAPAAKMDCREKMKAAGMDCSKDMAMMEQGMKAMPGMTAGVMPAGHDMPAATTAPAAGQAHQH
ncbi:MAG: hypothetical protein ABIR51_07420 [Sphingomicrobium sp.]